MDAGDRVSSGYDDAGGEAFYDADGELVSSPEYVITEGEMAVVVDEPTETAPLVADIVRAAGGYVEARSEWAPADGQSGSARMTLRIPADKLDETLEKIEALGELSRLSTSETDVSLQVKDLDARITALETSIDRLLAMLAEAERTEDLIQIEHTLQERQGELESMRAQRSLLGSRAALSSIELHLSTEPPPPTVGPGGFWPGVVTGWNALVNTLRGLTVVVGILLPWLVFFGILGFAIVKIVQRRRRNRPPRPHVTQAPGPYAPVAQYGGAPVAPHAPAPQPAPEPSPAPAPPATGETASAATEAARKAATGKAPAKKAAPKADPPAEG